MFYNCIFITYVFSKNNTLKKIFKSITQITACQIGALQFGKQFEDVLTQNILFLIELYCFCIIEVKKILAKYLHTLQGFYFT